MRRLTALCLFLPLITACSSDGNNAAAAGKPDQLVVLPKDLPGWGHMPTDEEAHGVLAPPLTHCFGGKTLPPPSTVGESFSYGDDTIRSRSHVYESAATANSILEIRQSQPFRDCVKTAFEQRPSGGPVEVAALPIQDSAGVSALEIRHLGKHPLTPTQTFVSSYKYIVTVTQDDSETVIEASHDPGAGGEDGAEIETIEKLVNKIKAR